MNTPKRKKTINNRTNNKKANKIEPVYLVLIFFIGIIVELGLIIYSIYSSRKMPGISEIIIMIGFFFIVAVVFWRSSKNFKIGKQINEDLIQATENITNKINNDNSNIYFDKVVLFKKNGVLRDAYIEFQNKNKKFEDQKSNLKTDLSEYINYDLVDDAIRAPMMNQIPGALVGLGILGTFLGLSVGLTSFTIGNDAKEMITTIQPLMDGIKVAFHTSICGMIYSLLFNYKYRRDVSKLQESVDLFLDRYEENVVSITQNGSRSTIVRFQEKMFEKHESQVGNQETIIGLLQMQNSSLSNMGRIISSSIRESTESMMNSVSEQISNMIVPKMDSLTKAMDSFTEDVSRDQKENLERIVNQFVMEMKSVLGGRFEAMGEVIDRTNELQKKTMETLEEAINRISSMTVDLGSINESLEKSITRVESYTTKVTALQDEIQNSLDNLNAQAIASKAMAEKHKEYLDHMIPLTDQIHKEMQALSDHAQESIERAYQTNRDYMDEMTNIIKEREQELEETYSRSDQLMSERLNSLVSQTKSITEQTYSVSTDFMNRMTAVIEERETHLQNIYSQIDRIIEERIESLKNEQISIANDIQQAGNRLSEIMKQLNNNLENRTKETFITFDKELAEISKHLAGTIQMIDQSVDKVPLAVNGIFSDMDDRFREMQLKLDQYLEYADKLHHNIEFKWNQLRQMDLNKG